MTTSRFRRVAVLTLLPGAALGLAACGIAAAGVGTASPGAAAASPVAALSSTAAPVPSPSADADPYHMTEVDPPAPGEPVLAVSPRKGAALELTLAQLEALGTTTVTLDEPFVKQRQTFTGVPLSAVTAAAGIPSGASLVTAALNAYEYTNTVSTFVASDALLATRLDGQPIPVAKGGPVRLVYPDGTRLASVLDAWNWSLSELRQA